MVKHTLTHCLSVFDNFVGLGLKNVRQPLDLIAVSIQPAITCSKLTIETLEQGVKQVKNKELEQVNS